MVKSNWIVRCAHFHENAANNMIQDFLQKAMVGDVRLIFDLMMYRFRQNDSATLNISKVDAHHIKLCETHGKLIQTLIKNAKRDHEILTILATAIKSHLPPQIRVNRHKKSWFDGLGSIISSVTGLGTKKKLKVVRKGIEQLEKIVKSESSLMTKSLHDITSYSKVANEKLANMIELIHQNALSTVEMITGITKLENNAMTFRLHILQKSTDLNNIMGSVHALLSEFYHSIQALIGGHLPPTLVTD